MQICGSKKTLDMCDMRLHFLFKKAVVNLVVNVDQKNLEIVEDMLAWQNIVNIELEILVKIEKKMFIVYTYKGKKRELIETISSYPTCRFNLV